MGGLFTGIGKELRGLFGSGELLNNLSAASAYLDGDYDRAGAIAARNRELKERLEKSKAPATQNQVVPVGKDLGGNAKKWAQPNNPGENILPVGESDTPQRYPDLATVPGYDYEYLSGESGLGHRIRARDSQGRIMVWNRQGLWVPVF